MEFQITASPSEGRRSQDLLLKGILVDEDVGLFPQLLDVRSEVFIPFAPRDLLALSSLLFVRSAHGIPPFDAQNLHHRVIAVVESATFDDRRARCRLARSESELEKLKRSNRLPLWTILNS